MGEAGVAGRSSQNFAATGAGPPGRLVRYLHLEVPDGCDNFGN
jgi:hypothetical protein